MKKNIRPLSLIDQAKKTLEEQEKAKKKESKDNARRYKLMIDDCSNKMKEFINRLGEIKGCEIAVAKNIFSISRNGELIADGSIFEKENLSHDGDGYSWGNGHFYYEHNYRIWANNKISSNSCSESDFAKKLVIRLGFK